MNTWRIIVLGAALIVVVGFFVLFPLRVSLPVTAFAALAFFGGRRFFSQASKLP